MHKISISGKGGVGKSVFSKFLISSFKEKLKDSDFGYKTAAFADPIKEIILKMFPNTDRKILYGKSELRSAIIPNAYLNNEPLTYRKLLQHLGTEVGQTYKKGIWLDVMQSKLTKAIDKKLNLFIVNDCRFIHEFNYLKSNNFKFIRIIGRLTTLNTENQQHSSEKEQELIKDEGFDFIVNNNKGLKELRIVANSIVESLIV